MTPRTPAREFPATAQGLCPDGWAAVDDAGRSLTLPTDALVGLRTLRPGQRIVIVTDDDGRLRARLP